MNTICIDCQSGCCLNLTFKKAKEILSEVNMFAPENMALVERILHPNTKNKTICAFFGESGCSLDSNEKPVNCISEEIRCKLFLIAHQNPALINVCLNVGKFEMINPLTLEYIRSCGENCPAKRICEILKMDEVGKVID